MDRQQAHACMAAADGRHWLEGPRTNFRQKKSQAADGSLGLKNA